MPIEFQEKLCETSTVTINYAEGPSSGPPLVLLHGGSGRWQNYKDILPDFAAQYHLYAPDFRGQGKSGRVQGEYHLQAFAEDTIAFLRSCVAEPAFLFGCSLGGMVALMVAAQCPDHVRAVVVGDSPLDRRPNRKEQTDRTRVRNATWQKLAGGRFSIEEIAEALRDAPTEIPGQDEPVTMREKYGEEHTVYDFVATNLYYTDPDMLAAVSTERFTAEYQMESVLPAIRCPVLLLQADPDMGCMMTDDEVSCALPLLAFPKYVQVKNAGHSLFLTEKEAVLRVIFEFLEDTALKL
jgi:pimeloyl-ACP methyl ester carboxylesterase